MPMTTDARGELLPPTPPRYPIEWRDPQALEPVYIEESKIRKTAIWFFGVTMLVFLVWAFYAPIDAGVSVNGTVTVLGKRKAVQHPKGGVVQSILTREGAKVKEGEVLLRINPLNTESELAATELQYINLLATEARLLSERMDQAAIAANPALKRYGQDPRVVEAEAIQAQLFRSRREDQRGQHGILNEQIAGLQAQIAGLQGQLKEYQAQLAILAQGSKDIRQLANEGYVPRSSADDLERTRSSVNGSIAYTQAELAKTRSAIAGARLQLLQLRINFRKDIDSQLAETQRQREALQAKVESQRFDLQLTDLKAPVGGTVVGLKTHTVGGVITAGEVLMEIVPGDETLIVEARVPPNDIDKVKTGMEADLHFTAFNVRTTPVIPGRVKLVGVDKVKYENSPDEYYLAQVEVTSEGRKLLGSLVVQPGMPVDVIIKAGERSFVSYLLKPLMDQFSKALKEP